MEKPQLPFGLTGIERGPFVGRESAMELLDSALHEVETGRETRIVTVLGATGVGKSRLIQEFVLKHRGASSLIPRVYRGHAREGDAAYAPFGRMLRMRFGLVESMATADQQSLLRSQVAQITGDRKVGDVLFFLGQFLDVPFDESPLTRAIVDDPMQGKIVRRAVFKAFLEADAAHSPMCLVFDDLHQAHADALDLLRYLIENLSGPILLLCSSQPELASRVEGLVLADNDRCRQVELDALPLDEARSLMGQMLAPATSATPEAREQLVDYACSFAAGSPTLLHQMLRVYHDRGVLEEEAALSGAPSWKVNLEKLDRADVPLTVADAIGVRISALSVYERRVLEMATVMGAVFWTAGIVPLMRTGVSAPEIWNRDGATDLSRVKETLTSLERRDYILRLPDSSLSNSDEYAFKHNMEREAIAARATSANLKRHHAVFSDWLDHQGETHQSEEMLLLLAEHRERAGDRRNAGLAHLAVADMARARYAMQAASAAYERGLELLGDSEVLRRIDALHNYGDVLSHMGQVDDASAMFHEMLTLAYRLDVVPKGGAAHNRLGRLCRDTGALDEAKPHLEAALSLFRASDDARGVASTIDDLGKLAWLKGDYGQSLELLRDGLARRRRLGDRRSIALSLNNLGIVLQETGEFRQAIETWQQALGIRRDIDDLVGVVATLNNLGTLHADRREFEPALTIFDEALEVARQVGDRNRIALVLVNVGEALHKKGEVARALEVLSQAEGEFDELGDRLGLADALRALGEAHLSGGDLAKARDCVGRAVDIFATVRSKVQLGVALRTLGKITAAGGWGAAHTKSASEYFARSISIFEETGNEVELARTQAAYAKFLRTDPGFRGDQTRENQALQLDEAANLVFKRLSGGEDGRPMPPTVLQDPTD